MPQIATEFVCLLLNGHNQDRVDMRHRTEGSNTHGQTDAGKEGEMRDHLDAGSNWQVQNTVLQQILPTVEKLLHCRYHLAGEIHQMQQQLYAVIQNKHNSEIMSAHHEYNYKRNTLCTNWNIRLSDHLHLVPR